MKKCTKCGKEKDEALFFKHKKTLDGYRQECKECTNKANKAWVARNPEKAREYGRKSDLKYREKRYAKKRIWAKKNYAKVLAYNIGRIRKYSKQCGLGVGTVSVYGFKLAVEIYDRAGRKCEQCGELNDLTIHHKDGKGVNLLKRGLKMNNHPENLIVLCRRCHGKIHGGQQRKGKI